jgi:cytochrome c-type biogenesis protein CcmH
MRLKSRVAATLLAALALMTPALTASAATPSTTLPAIESQVMCVTCKIPLSVAESPQSDRERAFIQSLIDEGQSETQIKSALVAQYGPTVLALPSTHGFDLAAYLVPLLALAFVLGVLALALPQWRRRGKSQATAEAQVGESALNPADAARLEADLARFD